MQKGPANQMERWAEQLQHVQVGHIRKKKHINWKLKFGQQIHALVLSLSGCKNLVHVVYALLDTCQLSMQPNLSKHDGY